MTRAGFSPHDGIVKVRVAGNRRQVNSTGVLSLPAHMSRAVPVGSLFRAEWHSDGILYRFMGIDNGMPIPTGDVPEWTKSDG